MGGGPRVIISDLSYFDNKVKCPPGTFNPPQSYFLPQYT